nr:reverse transcriptase domain-containing protein [Tanacetum cinerariifolium]
MQNQLNNLTELITNFVNSNSASTSRSGTLPSNTIANLRSDLKAITTRSGVSYDGTQISPPSSFLPKIETLVIQISEPIAYPVSAQRPNLRPSIPYPSRMQDQKLRNKVNDQCEKFFQIFKELNFNISFVDAQILMPKFGPSIKSLLTNKDKLCELARTLLNEHCLMILLKRSFLKTGRALIDVFEGELTLRVGKEAITFNLDQTSRYLANYNEITAKRIDVIDMDCEEYSEEVLGFSDIISSGNPTPYYDPIVSTTSLTLTLFENSDFLLEEVDAFLAIEDDLTSPKVNQSYLDPEGQVKLKDLPLHLKYAFLEGDDKFPVIIAKDLSVEEKTTLITVLKSHKRAIAWKLSDIK